MSGYINNITTGIRSLMTGMRLTLGHFFHSMRNKRKHMGVDSPEYFQQEGIVTLQYPREAIPVPDNGRYRLYNEIDDCIVCDLCAKICPVNCIEIEAVKSVGEIGKTSDGTTKRLYAARFDIDMAKCCYCGLCTTVCPTECLTMTKTYDYSEFDIRNMVYHFTDLTPAETEVKRKEIEEHKRIQEEAKAKAPETPQAKEPAKPQEGEKKPAFNPVFKPVIKPAPPKKDEGTE